MDIGTIIRTLRENKNLSQKELALQIGVSKSMVNKYESGVRRPSLEVLRKICHTLGVTADTLLGVNVDKDTLSIRDLTQEQMNALLTILQAFRRENEYGPS